MPLTWLKANLAIQVTCGLALLTDSWYSNLTSWFDPTNYTPSPLADLKQRISIHCLCTTFQTWVSGNTMDAFYGANEGGRSLDPIASMRWFRLRLEEYHPFVVQYGTWLAREILRFLMRLAKIIGTVKPVLSSHPRLTKKLLNADGCFEHSKNLKQNVSLGYFATVFFKAGGCWNQVAAKAGLAVSNVFCKRSQALKTQRENLELTMKLQPHRLLISQVKLNAK